MHIVFVLINTLQLFMPVTLRIKTYEWLKQIGVFRQQPIPINGSNQLCQIPYDQQIYLHNGYLIGVALRKFVKMYSSQYKELLKVRKIATLKSSQNWNIIEPYLMRIGYDSLMDNHNSINNDDDDDEKLHKIEEMEIEISLQKIGDILELIYDKYSPEEVENKMKNARRAKHNFIDIYNFTSSKPLNEAENTLEMICIILARNLEITLGEAMGLLMQKCKYLKKLVVEGSKKDEFQSIKKLYEDSIESWPIFEEYFLASPQDSFKILEGLSQGILSQNNDIMHLTLNLLSMVSQQQWFIKQGYYKLLSSTHIQCFYFTIQKLSPNYQKILNESLHSKIPDKIKLFTILQNLIKTLPRTIYCKEIFAHVPISYFYEQCYTVLNIEQIDDQPPKVVVRAKQLLAKLIVTYPDKIPNQYLTSVLDTFKYNGNRPYGQTYHTLALLFQILQGIMRKQSPYIQKFFKLVMKYLKETFGEVKHWIIQNLRQLYERMGKLFPLGCMLAMYSIDSVAQADQYNLFSLICNDTHKLSQQQSTLTLQYLTKYITTQLHCKCFLPLLYNFLANHSNSSGKWAEDQCIQILSKIQQINIPMLNQGQINVLNPKPPTRNKAINSIGMKRKQMLKFNQYELAKQMIGLLLHVRDKPFLNYYSNMIGHTIAGIQKEIGHKKKQLVNMLKNTRKKIKKKMEEIPDSQNMDEIMKSMVNREQSSFSNAPISRKSLTRPGPLLSGGTAQSKYPLSQSRLLDSHIFRHSTKTIKQQDEDADDKNQFINSKFKVSGPDKTKNKNQDASDQQNSIWRGTQDQEGEWKNPRNKNYDLQANKTGLMDFTQQGYDQAQDHAWSVQLYPNEALQSHEIAYIKSILLKYFSVLSACKQIYQECIKQSKQVDNFLPKFMSRVGLASLIESHKSQLIFLKCKTVFSKNEHSQFVSSYLVQLAFQIFAFKQNRRIRVTCVESLFRVIYDNVREIIDSKDKKNKNGGFTQSIKYQHIVHPKLLQNIWHKTSVPSKLKSYAVCFQILSEICFSKIGVHIVQPISKQVSELGTPPMLPAISTLTPSLIVRHKTESMNRQQSFDQGEMFDQQNGNQAEEELKFLQKQLQKLQIPQQQQKLKQRDRKSANFTLKSMKRMKLRGETKPEVRSSHEQLTTKASKILNTNEANKKPVIPSVSSATNSKQLRSKLSQRIKLLHGELAKQSAKPNQVNLDQKQKPAQSADKMEAPAAVNDKSNTNQVANN